MRLDDYRTSDNVEGGREGGGLGFGGGGGGGLGMLLGLVASKFGIVGIVILLAGMWLFGGLGGITGGGGPTGVQQSPRTGQSAANVCATSADATFSCRVLASTEDTWSALFKRSGEQYRPTTMVLYTGGTQSGCGAAQSAMGPFYCPSDERVYLDTSFFQELSQRFRAAGDFAQAYVIAHEVGHHIQNLTGTADRVRQAQQAAGSRAAGNALSVKLELQADCYAGVWAANNRDRIEPGDVEEGLRAAQAIGDDTLQKAGQGVVVPESFTHGTSAQRQYWLKRGLDTGDPARCDTFAAGAPA